MFAYIKKFGVVIILTGLIWIWADKAMTLTRSDIPATIHIDKQIDQHLWVALDRRPFAQIKLKVSGPSARIDQMDKQLKEKGTLGFDFYLNPTSEGMFTPGTPYRLPLLQFIQKSKLIQDLGLTVESCTPEAVSVEVVKLVNQSLAIQVLNENKVPVNNAILEPAVVDMLVPENWTGEARKATIILTSQEIEQTAPVTRRPFVELDAGLTRLADTHVKVSLPSTESRLRDYTIDETNIGLTYSYTMQGSYKVDILNRNQVFGAVKIRATPEAKAQYDNIPYKMRLNIIETDAKAAGEVERELIFNLPEEYVRKGEITINEPQPRRAKFRLVPITSGENTASIGEMPSPGLPKGIN